MTIVKRTDYGPVAHIQMNAPERLNALSDDLMAGMQDELNRLESDSAIRAIIISGAGKVFCAGHDLKEMTAGREAPDGGTAYFADLFQRCATLMQTLPRLPQPVIAQAHGIATAAGCQMVASCDLAVAADDTRFGVNGVNIGLFCSTPMVALSRNIPRKKAFEMLTTGDFITAQQAEEFGLINRAVPIADLENETLELASKIAAKLGSAVKVGKRAFYDQLQLPLDQAYAMTGQVMVENMMNKDTAEGIQSFIEKRKPDWKQ